MRTIRCSWLKKAENHYGLGFTVKAGYKGLSLDVVLAGSFGGWAEIDGDAREKTDNKISNADYSRPVIWNNIYDARAQSYRNNAQPALAICEPVARIEFLESERIQNGREKRKSELYKYPKSWWASQRLNSARVAFTILNPLFLFNPYSYKTPEGSYDAYPNLRTYSLGVNLVF